MLRREQKRRDEQEEIEQEHDESWAVQLLREYTVSWTT